MADVEMIFTKADFAGGSDHKEQLRARLFHDNDGAGPGRLLSDEELDLAAAGVGEFGGHLSHWFQDLNKIEEVTS